MFGPCHCGSMSLHLIGCCAATGSERVTLTFYVCVCVYVIMCARGTVFGCYCFGFGIGSYNRLWRARSSASRPRLHHAARIWRHSKPLHEQRPLALATTNRFHTCTRTSVPSVDRRSQSRGLGFRSGCAIPIHLICGKGFQVS